ncbi:MAG: APC family permease [Armatimonadetes bacterium]|nr:APC family permease [Armatimonadota bacterium]
MPHPLRRLLLGHPLPTHAEVHERLTKMKALAIFASDALSSVAYGPEEILLALMIVGTAALHLSVPIAIAIAVLLAVVTTSYHQTVHGYPSGGGAYVVAHENLGRWLGLVAGSALLIDYVLTVAVSIAAGAAAITSAVPELASHKVALCVAAILVIAWANLRGVRESGTVFALPTYAFIGLFLLLLGVGFTRMLSGSLAPVPPPAQAAHIIHPATALSLFIILRAFASGCATLTGVEAISNGVQAFHRPEARNAGKTLVAMAVLLGVMLLGTTVLARAMDVQPAAHETVISQIARAVLGGGPLYYALQAATALILVLAANTSFAGFPRLSAILARDGFLPRQLTNRGDRLVFANGILALALLASLLVVLFEGQTHRLIPLYAVGVFLSFTLSQAGMVRHWAKERGRGWALRSLVNGLGGAVTGVVLLIVVTTKFVHGAWVVCLLIPAAVAVLHAISRHYDSVAKQLSLNGISPEGADERAWQGPPKVVVPISGIHRGTLAALRFARSLSDDVRAVTVAVNPEASASLQAKWREWAPHVPLVVVESPYRSIMDPLLDFLHQTDAREPERGLAVVVLPEFITASWWQHLLHNQTALLLKTLLVYRRRQPGEASRVVINVPFHLEH